MTDHPYSSLPPAAYWRSGVAELSGAPTPDYYTPKWRILKSDAIATAGSCFAQHIGSRLKSEGYNVLDVEPAPDMLPTKRYMDYGYAIYSARYGNIYTARQMLQLAEEALGERPPSDTVWEADGLYFDALRPTIEPEGHSTREAVQAHRSHHLEKVRGLLLSADILVFTLGLTETWEDIATGQVFPVCPGTVAGRFDHEKYRFLNLTFQENFDDLMALRALLHRQERAEPTRILLTVSPVPLTATASGNHVMSATVYSKSVLRAVAGQICDECSDVDYFPSFEIVASPWAPEHRYARNMRSVTDASVALVMQTFMTTHSDNAAPSAMSSISGVSELDDSDLEMAIKCDEELLDSFGPARK